MDHRSVDYTNLVECEAAVLYHCRELAVDESIVLQNGWER